MPTDTRTSFFYLTVGALVTLAVIVSAVLVSGDDSSSSASGISYGVLEGPAADLRGTPLLGITEPEASNLILESLRLATTTPAGPIFAGEGVEGRLCLAVVEEDGVRSTCPDPTAIPTGGVIPLGSLNGSRAARVTVLAPDGFDTAAAGGRSVTIINNVAQLDVDRADIALTLSGADRTQSIPLEAFTRQP